MDGLDGGDLLKGNGRGVKALLPGRGGEGGIDRLRLLQLVVPGMAQQLEGIVGDVRRVAAVDENSAAGGRFHVAVKDLRVGLFLPGSKEEHGLQHLEALPAAGVGGEGVAVPGLALSGKGPHQVFQCLAVFPFHG